MIMGLVARCDVKDAVDLAGKMADFLIERGVDIVLDVPLANELGKYHDRESELEDMDVDMVVAVGGDGTILRTQSFISHKKTPIIGINMGTVGFLTEIDPENTFTAIEEILAGNYFVERRNQLLVWHNHDLPPHLTKWCS